MKKKYEVMDLTNFNPYDNDEVLRCGTCLRFRYHHGFRGAGPAMVYDIELDRLDTPTKVYQWIIHLLGKNWVTRDMLHRMVAILEIHFQYDLHEFTDAALNTPSYDGT